MEEPQSGSEGDEDRSLKTAESLRAFRDQAGQTLNEHKECVGEIETRLNEQFERISAELARERLDDEQQLVDAVEQSVMLEKLQQTLVEKEAEVEEVLEQLATQSQEFEAQLTERDEELEQVLELGEEESQQREVLERELDSARQSIEDVRAESRNECEQNLSQLAELDNQLAQFDHLEKQVETLEERYEAKQREFEEAQQALHDLRAEDCSECKETRSQLEEIEQQLSQRSQLEEQFQTLENQHEAQQVELGEVRQALQAAQEENERATKTLLEVEQRFAELSQQQRDNEQTEKQLEQTTRKFELASADAHKLRRENTELREELLSRPEASDQESPELVSLRAERDALAERISELENAPTPEASDDDQKAREDLQRRFEMAVDDVRQLKQENADVLQRLKAAQSAATASPSSSPQDEGPLDWQAQKARLMAALDAEDQGTLDEQRREDRATVGGTISITDRVVAEKDALLAKREAEVAGLKSQLESRPAGQDQDALREQIAAEILADDEAVKAECTKLQQQQQELDSKLREAELEISVQRATLAREQAALAEKLSRLPDEESDSEKISGEKPRRRWLSALGIKDEDEEES